MSEECKALIYSPAGHGKTTLLGTIPSDPRLHPGLLVNFEGGTRSIRSKLRDLDVLAEAAGTTAIEILASGDAPTPVDGKLDSVRVKTWDDFNVVYDFLNSANNPYKTVALDSLSEMNWLNLFEVVENARKGDSRHDPDIAEQRDYLRSTAQMRSLIRFFRDLPMNVFFTAGTIEAENPRTRKTELRPQLTGRLVGEVPGLVEVVAYLAVVEDGDDEYRALYLRATERFMAKARTEFPVPAFIKDPTLGKLLDVLEGKALSTAE